MLSNLTVNIGLRYRNVKIQPKSMARSTTWRRYGKTPALCADTLGIGQCAGFSTRPFSTTRHSKNFEPGRFCLDPFHDGKTSVPGDRLLMSCPFRICLRSIPCKPLRTEPNDLNKPGQDVPKGLDFGNYRSAASIGVGSEVSYVEHARKRNDVLQYNFNIQRQVTASTS